MSLFGSLQTASNTLQAMQIGLQVVGNNIANANTEGFIRERANFTPAPVQEFGRLTLGLGVQVDSITQVIDEFLGSQLRDATGDHASAKLQNEAYKKVENLLGELSDTDLSTSLTQFFGSIDDTTNAESGDPLSVRNLTVLQGEQLAREVRRIADAGKDLRDSYDSQISQSIGQVNQLTTQIAELNVRITQLEGGSSGKSDAGALRGARNQAINTLTELVSASVVEQPSGGVSISVGGEFLVFEGQRREVGIDSNDQEGESASQLIFADTGKALAIDSGRLHGLAVARDDIVDGFRDSLDEFASTLINEFNRVYSQGQGIDGFRTLTSNVGLDSSTAPLNDNDLPLEITNGEFGIQLVNDEGVVVETARIKVHVGIGDESSLASIVSQINDVDGLNASIDTRGRLTIATDSGDNEFAFAGDDSGFLASLGLNTFFVGSNANDIGVNQELSGIRNAGKLALSNSGLGDTTGNAIALSGMVDQPLDSLDGASIFERYDQMVNEISQNSTVAGSVADGLKTFESTLANEFQAISGVNIDEEAVDMISLQRIYQATARVIATIQEMLDTLVRL